MESQTKDPHIVYCPNHHIYDSSLYKECPYCLHIKKEKQALEHYKSNSFRRSVRADTAADVDATEFLPNSQDPNATVMLRQPQYGMAPEHPSDEDETMMLDRQHAGTVALSDETELAPNNQNADDTCMLPASETYVYHEEGNEVAPGDERLFFGGISNSGGAGMGAQTTFMFNAGEYDEALTNGFSTMGYSECPDTLETVTMPAGDFNPTPAVKKLMGWVVFTKSACQYGTSVELKDGLNLLNVLSDGHVIIQNDRTEQHDCIAEIYRNEDTGIFQIRPGNMDVTLNGRTLEREAVLESYSRIECQNLSMVFFPAIGVCGFDWR